jgi:hypothetical protein
MELEEMCLTDETKIIWETFLSNIEVDADAMFYIDDNGQFYFIVSHLWDIEGFIEKSGYLIADMTHYNNQYLIGWGVHSLGYMKCLICGNAFSDTEFETLRDALRFTFLGRKLSLFYPGVRRFKHTFKLDGHPCYALYDYIPKGRDVQESVEARMAKNLVFKFKEGKMPTLTARLLSLAAAEVEGLIPKPQNTILVPIPASTKEGNDKRFRKFCRELATSLGVTDGFELIELDIERKPNAVRKGMPLSNAIKMPDTGRFIGKDVIIVDDVVTSGEQFRQMATYVKSADARVVKGLFVAKTLEPEEKKRERGV